MNGRVLWRGNIWDVIGGDTNHYVLRRVTYGWRWGAVTNIEHLKRVRKRRCTPITEADPGPLDGHD